MLTKISEAVRRAVGAPPWKLEWDSAADAAEARRRGWKIDQDDWWYRDMRGEDKMFSEESHFGFTISELSTNNKLIDRVYVRSAEYALSYDKGVIIPYRREAA
jgi:hypothetical protein